MPPFVWWLRGRADIRRALLAADGTCHGSRLLPTNANGAPAFGQYLPGPDGELVPQALVILTVSGGKIVEETAYLDTARLFALFGLPERMESPARR